jgi:hypothetical protein
LRGRDGGRSLTIHPALGPARGRDLADLAGRAVLGLVDRDLTGLVDLGPVDLGPVDRVVLGLVGPGLQDLTGRADLVDLDLVAPVGRADLVDLGLVDLGRAVLGLVDRVGLAVTGLVVRVDRVGLAVTGLVVRVDRGLLVGLEDLVVPAVQDPTDLAVQGDRVDLAARVDRHRPRTGPKVPTIGVTRKWAARVTRRTASAHPTTVRRHRPGSMDSAGTADLLPEGLRLTGMARRLRVAGTVLRLPVAGTLDGMGRRAT